MTSLSLQTAMQKYEAELSPSLQFEDKMVAYCVLWLSGAGLSMLLLLFQNMHTYNVTCGVL